MEQSVKLLEESLLLIWNDRNEHKRLATMKEIYNSDICFYEANDSEPIIGHEAINMLITRLQSQWPTEFIFELVSPVKVNHKMQLASWRLGVTGQEPAATGTDIATIENGKIASLTLFM